MLLKPQKDEKVQSIQSHKGSHKVEVMSHTYFQSIGPLGSLRAFCLIREGVTLKKKKKCGCGICLVEWIPVKSRGDLQRFWEICFSAELLAFTEKGCEGTEWKCLKSQNSTGSNQADKRLQDTCYLSSKRKYMWLKDTPRAQTVELRGRKHYS